MKIPMKISIKTSGAACLLYLLIIASSINAFAQTETIESLTARIEANPKEASNYRARGDLYSDLANEKEFPANLRLVARSVADYSAYLRLKPNDAQVLRMRGLARRDLFTEVNPFALSDTSRAFRLNRRDLEARDEIRSQNAEYQKFYRSKPCREARSKNGFQGHASDEPLTALAAALDPEMTEDATIALKYIACGPARATYNGAEIGDESDGDFNEFGCETDRAEFVLTDDQGRTKREVYELKKAKLDFPAAAVDRQGDLRIPVEFDEACNHDFSGTIRTKAPNEPVMLRFFEIKNEADLAARLNDPAIPKNLAYFLSEGKLLVLPKTIMATLPAGDAALYIGVAQRLFKPKSNNPTDSLKSQALGYEYSFDRKLKLR